MLIDAHCHVERETYGDELEDVIQRAFDAGLSHMVVVGATRVADGADEAVATAEKYDNIFATVGLHPHEAEQVDESHVARIEAYLDHPKVVALGEIGLDFFYDNSPRERQREVFEQMATMSRDRNMPVMLHVRDAHQESCEVMDAVGLPQAGGVVHCFSGGPKEAQDYLERGFYLSIPGIVTFKKADELREAVRLCPLDRLLVETDSPYLAPVPYRGKRNEPAYVVETAKQVAEIKGLSFEALAEATAQNTARLFRLAI